MKKHFWKTEYSITIIILFACVLFLIPVSFSSREAKYISEWNQEYGKLDYLFMAMKAQADSDIVKGLKNAKTEEQREFFMMELVKPYLRLEENERLASKYKLYYMNGKRVLKDDFYHFDNLYLYEKGNIIGIKDVKNDDKNSSGFMIMMDMNGMRGPNSWGRDVYGINIYPDGRISALGKGLSVAELKNDCSPNGKGVYCSHYYRIGGEFTE